MKEFLRTSLPESIKYNKHSFVRSTLLSARHQVRQPFNRKGCIMVKVLSKNLKGKTDLYRQPYKPTEWIYVKALQPKFSEGMLGKYGPRYHNHDDAGFALLNEWLDATYPYLYSNVKEGDYFILWNGEGNPVPFVQMQDETPDKWNRPTRLLDGCYLSLKPTMRVAIVTKEEAAQLKAEIKALP